MILIKTMRLKLEIVHSREPLQLPILCLCMYKVLHSIKVKITNGSTKMFTSVVCLQKSTKLWLNLSINKFCFFLHRSCVKSKISYIKQRWIPHVWFDQLKISVSWKSKIGIMTEFTLTVISPISFGRPIFPW